MAGASQSVTIPPRVEAAIMNVLDYLWDDEREHSQSQPNEGHIFDELRIVRQWLSESSRTELCSGESSSMFDDPDVQQSIPAVEDTQFFF